MKKMMIMLGVSAIAVCAFARPHGGPGHGHGHGGPAPRHYSHHPPSHHYHRSHHGCAWGRGGRNFWPGFVGGVVAGALVDGYIGPRVTETVVVQQPVVTTTPVVVDATPVVASQTVVQRVWVEGRYIDQIQPNGTVVRVWQPGHYEQRAVSY